MSSKLVDEIGQFTFIPNWIIEMGGKIGPDGLALVVAFRFHSSKTGEIFPNYDTIQEETGLTRRRIAKAIRHLESLGLLERKRRFGSSTVYHLKIKKDAISTDDGLMEKSSSTDGGLMEQSPLVQGVDQSSTGGGLSLVQGVHTNQINFNQTQLTRENLAAGAANSSPAEVITVKEPEKPKDLFDESTTEGRGRKSIVEAMNRGAQKDHGLKEEIEQYFRISPNWNTKTARYFMLWLKDRPANQTIQAFSEWWYSKDWRGKTGQPPTLANIMELWPQAFIPAPGAYKLPTEADRGDMRQRIAEAKKKREAYKAAKAAAGPMTFEQELQWEMDWLSGKFSTG